jgi:hypothetical protein
MTTYLNVEESRTNIAMSFENGDYSSYKALL